MATHSSVLAWRIPGTAEPGGLLSMGSHRVGHDWSDLAVAAAYWSWVPISFSRGFSLTQGWNPSLLHRQLNSLPLSHLGSPQLWKLRYKKTINQLPFLRCSAPKQGREDLSLVQEYQEPHSSRPHELQHARPPCSSPTPGIHSDSSKSSFKHHQLSGFNQSKVCVLSVGSFYLVRGLLPIEHRCPYELLLRMWTLL